MSSIKVMMRRPDYDYVSTVAVLYGVTVPAALSLILKGVRDNGLQIVLPKDSQSTVTVPPLVQTTTEPLIDYDDLPPEYADLDFDSDIPED